MDERIEAAHRRAVEAGRDAYEDPATGYLVFTADFLRARGTCCGSGCRHCPYPADGAGGSDDAEA